MHVQIPAGLTDQVSKVFIDALVESGTVTFLGRPMDCMLEDLPEGFRDALSFASKAAIATVIESMQNEGLMFRLSPGAKP